MIYDYVVVVDVLHFITIRFSSTICSLSGAKKNGMLVFHSRFRIQSTAVQGKKPYKRFTETGAWWWFKSFQ